MKRLVLVIGLCALVVLSAASAPAEVKNPDTFILAQYGNLRTLDPAVAYDVTSSQRLWNIYEPLIFFLGEHTDQFKPLLATEVPSLENGGISADGKTYTFTIRKNVNFHEGQTLTPEDVVYSFKRNMIVDPDGGPMWMLLEALTGEGSTRDKDGKIIDGIFDKIDKCVEAKGDQVIFHLPKPYPPFHGHSGLFVLGDPQQGSGPSPTAAGTATSPMPPSSTIPPPGTSPCSRSPTAPTPTR